MTTPQDHRLPLLLIHRRHLVHCDHKQHEPRSTQEQQQQQQQHQDDELEALQATTIDGLKAENRRLQTTVAELESRMRQLQDALTSSRQQWSELNSQMDNAARELNAQMDSAAQKMERKEATLQTLFQTQAAEIERLRAQLAEVASDDDRVEKERPNNEHAAAMMDTLETWAKEYEKDESMLAVIREANTKLMSSDEFGGVGINETNARDMIIPPLSDDARRILEGGTIWQNLKSAQDGGNEGEVARITRNIRFLRLGGSKFDELPYTGN